MTTPTSPTPSLPNHPRRLATLLRTLLNCGYFGPALPPVQSMVLKMRVPKTIVEDALQLLHEEGHVEVHAKEYRRVYRAPQAIHARIGIFTERNIFAPYFEVYQDYLLGIAEAVETAGFDIIFSHDLGSTAAKLVTVDEFIHAGAKGMAVLGRVEPEVRADLLARQLPTVICGNASIEQRDFACFCSDNIFGTKDLVQYLIDIGHRDIAYYATAAHSHDGTHHRILGYRDAMTEAGLAPREELVLNGVHSAASANGAAQLFAGLKKKPSVIVCATDREAFELISELQKSGLKVPRDVSVAGFEDSLFSSLSEPGLTTVDIHPREMGRAAGKFLMESLQAPQLPSRTVLPSRIVQRGSVIPRAQAALAGKA